MLLWDGVAVGFQESKKKSKYNSSGHRSAASFERAAAGAVEGDSNGRPYPISSSGMDSLNLAMPYLVMRLPVASMRWTLGTWGAD
jgi:hypothetical protein